MSLEIFAGIMLPFLGTALGSGCVFFMKSGMKPSVERNLNGFAAGVMVAASIWSLLLPAIDQAADLGKWSFLPAAGGFWLGILTILLSERLIAFLQEKRKQNELNRRMKKSAMLALAVTLHNLPEGIAVGVAFAGWLAGNERMALSGALALTVGIAVQNFPEGAIISMPLHGEGTGKFLSFLYGTLSGVVEPVGAVLTILASGFFSAILPYCLSFAAGAMFYVVVEELLPEIPDRKQANIRMIVFSLGFTLMMMLDVAFG